ATGAFLVDNGMSHPVEAPIDATPFRDGDGQAVEVDLRVEPGVVRLAPGEQALVRVAATIPEAAAAGVDHRATISVPTLPGTPVTLVLRRLA
ncbi:MAG: hypothetical protein ACRD0F_05915, partial [Acidimicrobiales bacterium]